MIREEEAAQAHGPSTASAVSASAPVSRPAPSSTSNAPMDEDEAMWDAMDDFSEEPYVPRDQGQASKNLTASAPAVDEDEDMWDMIREVEQERETAEKNVSPPPGATGPPADSGSTAELINGPTGMVGVDPTRPATNDEGGDEMYA